MTDTPAIEYKSLASLKCWQRNYRHGDISAITQSLLRFGFNGALRVWRDNTVIAGNHTLLALQGIKASGLQAPRNVREIKGAWHVAVIDCSWMTEIEAQAFAVADNRTSELADNDEQRLAELLTEIASEDAKLLAATGYDGDDLDGLLSRLTSDALRFDYGNAQEGGSEGVDYNATESTVRMVQLFFDLNTVVEFNQLTRALADQYQTKTITDTVLEAVRRACHTNANPLQ